MVKALGEMISGGILADAKRWLEPIQKDAKWLLDRVQELQNQKISPQLPIFPKESEMIRRINNLEAAMTLAKPALKDLHAAVFVVGGKASWWHRLRIWRK